MAAASSSAPSSSAAQNTSARTAIRVRPGFGTSARATAAAPAAGAEEVRLELHRQHGGAFRHQGEGGVAGGGVGQRGERAGVEEAVLLRELGAEGQA